MDESVQYSKEDVYLVYCLKLFHQKFNLTQQQLLKYQPTPLKLHLK